MEMIISDNQAARDAIKAVCAEKGISLTRLSELQGISMGSLGRFVNQRVRTANGREIQSANVHLLTFIRALDGVGYEVVVRPKAETVGSRRERRLRQIKERANGKGGTTPGHRG